LCLAGESRVRIVIVSHHTRQKRKDIWMADMCADIFFFSDLACHACDFGT